MASSTVTLEQLAEHELKSAGRTVSTAVLRKSLKRAGVPIHRGRVDLRAAVAAREAGRELDKASGNVPVTAGTINESRKRKIDLECKQIELEIAESEKRLVPVEEVNALIDEIGGVLKFQLGNFVSAVAAELRDPVLLKRSEEIRDRVLADVAAMKRE